jgi:hypothetical protein
VKSCCSRSIARAFADIPNTPRRRNSSTVRDGSNLDWLAMECRGRIALLLGLAVVC